MRERVTSLGKNVRVDLTRAAVALVALTGLIHVYVGVTRGRFSLLLAGLGFFGGIGVFLAGYRPRQFYLAGIGYVLLQIALWLVFQAGEYTPIGVLDKAIQTVLVVVLGLLYWTGRPS